MNQSHRLIWPAVVILSSAALLINTYINGFPLIFPDSSDYIMLTPRIYRSPFYQIWVFVTGWKVSLYYTVIAQAFLTSALLTLFLRVEIRATPLTVITSILSLCVFSSLPVFVSFIMPDFFTGIMFIALFMFIFRWDRLSGLMRIGLFAVTVLAISVHLSHLVMAVGIIFVGSLLNFARHGRNLPKAGAVVAIMACALVAGAATVYNSVVFNRFQLSPAGSTFFVANLIAKGPARAELLDTCPRAGYRLCGHLSELSNSADEMLWGKGLFVRMGGIGTMIDESRHLVAATLRHRPLEVVTASLTSTLAALTTTDPTAEIHSTTEFVRQIVGLVYGPAAKARYDAAAQARNAYPRAITNLLIAVGGAVAMVTIIANMTMTRRKDMTFVLYVFACFLGNALVCATLSGVHDRYQSRISWLLFLAALVLLLARGNNGAGCDQECIEATA